MSNNYHFRDYQIACVRVILSEWRSHLDNVLVSLPVGSGKTVIMRHLVEEIQRIKPDAKILILTPKNILIEQTEDKLGPSAVYNAGLKRREIGNVTIASVQSFWKVKEFYNAILVDEVHRWMKYHDIIVKNIRLLNNSAKLVGFTGTPFTGQHVPIFRPDGFFKKVSFQKTLKEMTDQGYLCPIVYQETRERPDLSQVGLVAGDYNQGEIDLIMRSKVKELTEEAVRRSAHRKRVIWLCCSIEHAEEVHSIVGDSIIHSKRQHLRDDWRHLVSVLMVSEGFDFPAADCLVMMRPTRSPVLYIQAAGRILRPHPDKTDGLFIDCGRVIENLGSIYDYKPTKKFKPKEGRLCPICDSIFFEKSCKCGYVPTTMCPTCLTLKPIGAACCESKKIDFTKNLALPGGERWVKVDYGKVEDYTSKAGRTMKRVKCVCGFQTYYDWFKTRVPKEICLVRDGKWDKIVARRY